MQPFARKKGLYDNPQPLVTVVMPAFNASDTIQQAMESVLLQTMPRLELIVCDDASTDGTSNIVSQVSDARVRRLVNTTQLGPGPSRDKAIAAARAPWIALLDADDAWDKGRLQALLAAVPAGGNCMVFDDLLICHTKDTRLAPWRRLHGRGGFGASGRQAIDVPLERYLCSDRLLIKPLFPRKVVQQLGIRHSSRLFGEDAEFFIRLGLAGLPLRYVPQALYHYRITPGSLTLRSADKSLMRQCIEQCAKTATSSGLMTPSLLAAFEKKIELLRLDESLYEAKKMARQGNELRAMLAILSQPALLHRMFQRLPSHAHNWLGQLFRRQ